MTEIEKSLGKLAEEINAEHRAFVGAFRKTVAHGIRAGELLTAAKEQCPHGTWLSWLEENFDGSTRTAQNYMRLYKHRDEVRAKTQDSAHLSVDGALTALASPMRPEWRRERAIHDFVEAKMETPSWYTEEGPSSSEKRRLQDLGDRIDEADEAVTPLMLAGVSPREWGAFKTTIPPEKMDTPIAQLRREGYTRPDIHHDVVVGGTVYPEPYTPEEQRAYLAQEKLRLAEREYWEAMDDLASLPDEVLSDD